MRFRIWNKQLNHFGTDDEWFINGKGEVFYYDKMDGELVKTDKSNCIIQLFTDLYDKDDAPIFEGDCLNNPVKNPDNCSYKNMRVEYKFGRWVLNDMEDLVDYWVDNTTVGNITTLKIVGNIFEK
jgi:hypothetical protein